jgi:hypothetical protein
MVFPDPEVIEGENDAVAGDDTGTARGGKTHTLISPESSAVSLSFLMISSRRMRDAEMRVG